MSHRAMGFFVLALLAHTVLAGSAFADEPLTERFSFRRASDFFATGATLAADNDGDNKVDTLLPAASVFVEEADLVPNAFLQQALVYWGGTVAENDNCAGGDDSIDEDVFLTPPGGSETMISADVCYCAGGENQSRDIQSCRTDVTALAQGGAMTGPWSLGGFQAEINNGDIDTASFALVLVFGAPGLPPRQLTIYDGLSTMRYDTLSFELDDLEVDAPPAGDLTWYVMEGDVGGSSNESVSVRGIPGGRSLVLSDDVNPAEGPMNRTINTTYPAQEGVVGVDIDSFDISEALLAGDHAVEVTYEAGSDKWWLAFNIVGVQLFYSEFGSSALTWVLSDDVGGDGTPSAGDTLRYGIELVNSGDGHATVSLSASLPPAVASWSVLGVEGGTDASSPSELIVESIPVAAGQSARIDFEVVVGDVSAGSTIAMEASFDVVGGGTGVLTAPDVIIGAAPPRVGIEDAEGADSDWQQACACSNSSRSNAGLWMLLALAGLLHRRVSGPPGLN